MTDCSHRGLGGAHDDIAWILGDIIGVLFFVLLVPLVPLFKLFGHFWGDDA